MKVVGDPSSYARADSVPKVVPASSAMKGSFSVLSTLAIWEHICRSRRYALVSELLICHKVQHVLYGSQDVGVQMGQELPETLSTLFH